MKKKIYIVEDNEKNLELFIAVLETIPELEIFSSTTGKEGLKLIQSENRLCWNNGLYGAI